MIWKLISPEKWSYGNYMIEKDGEGYDLTINGILIGRYPSRYQAGIGISEFEDGRVFTLQQTADYLGIPLGHCMGLVGEGKLVALVKIDEVRAYGQKLDDERRAAIDKMFSEISENGLYDATYTGEEQ